MEYKQNGKQITCKRIREHGYTIAPGDLRNTPATGRKTDTKNSVYGGQSSAAYVQNRRQFRALLLYHIHYRVQLGFNLFFRKV